MPLKITVRSVLPAREVGDLMVVGVPALGSASKKKNARSPLDGFDRALGGALGRLLKKEEFKGKKDQQVSMSTLGRVKADRLVLIGLGDVAKLGPGDIRTFAAKAARTANADKAKRLVLGLPERPRRPPPRGRRRPRDGRLSLHQVHDRRSQAEGGAHAGHDLPHRRSPGRREGARRPRSGRRRRRQPRARPVERAAERPLPRSASPPRRRSWRRTPASRSRSSTSAEIQKRGMRLLQAVGQGSEHKPCMVHFSHVPAGCRSQRGRRRIVIVGKGITFDSGGLSIKPAAGMGEMKHDMSGAANVVGLMSIVGAPQAERRGARHLRRRREHAGRQRVSPRRRLGLARRQERRDHQHRRRGSPDPRRRARLCARARARSARRQRDAHRRLRRRARQLVLRLVRVERRDRRGVPGARSKAAASRCGACRCSRI